VVSVISQLQERSGQHQPITGEERSASANHRRGVVSVISQLQKRSGQRQPITGEEWSASANHRLGAVSVALSQERSG
jgi:hypothetical protein